MNLAINIGKVGAPHGMQHPRARVPFRIVELARSLHESGMPPRKIEPIVELQAGKVISRNTLDSWLYYHTRIYG